MGKSPSATGLASGFPRFFCNGPCGCPVPWRVTVPWPALRRVLERGGAQGCRGCPDAEGEEASCICAGALLAPAHSVRLNGLDGGRGTAAME